MPSRIDDKTMLPLSLVAVLFATGISVTATGAFWVSKVNDRLSRIEEKLGVIQPSEKPFTYRIPSAVEAANAAQRKIGP